MLQAETEALAGKLATKDGGWIVKGFIDVFRNVYTISDDTKVISKLIEIMLFPALAEFASREGLKLVPAAEQNHYPDISFIDKDGFRYAVDFKTTYRTNTTSVNTMTLGAFTGYFRERESTKNITFPYSSYKGHFVLGVIYSRAEARANELKKFGIDELTNIPSVVRDFDFFAQPKFKIAKDLPGSGNTKNIGSVNDLAALKSGGGPFASLGEAVFDDYWMHYLTADMALAAELAAPPYRDIASYFAFKRIPDTSGEHK
ncbi:EcoRV family type II restriction endonuclease [bacterium]|nr:EcoRV family type II restriction endonuclease [bacterium]MBU1985522.1 EcoRV family type II restriction endonuclease [bacterium]